MSIALLIWNRSFDEYPIKWDSSTESAPVPPTINRSTHNSFCILLTPFTSLTGLFMVQPPMYHTNYLAGFGGSHVSRKIYHHLWCSLFLKTFLPGCIVFRFNLPEFMIFYILFICIQFQIWEIWLLASNYFP